MDIIENDYFKDVDHVVKLIYKKLIGRVKKFDQVKVEFTPTSVHLLNRFSFAGIYLRPDNIILEFQLDYRLKSDRVKTIDSTGENHFHHAIILETENDIDEQLLTWLKEAYDLKK